MPHLHLLPHCCRVQIGPVGLVAVATGQRRHESIVEAVAQRKVPHAPGQLLGQGILPPAVDHGSQGHRRAHAPGKHRVPQLLAVRGQAQQPAVGLGVLPAPVHRAHAGGQKTHQRGELLVIGIKVDPQLGKAGPPRRDMNGIAVHIGGLCRLLMQALTPDVGAPFAQRQPAGPLAVHQYPGLGLHHRAFGRLGVPAHGQLPESREANLRRGKAAVQHIPPAGLLQADGVFGQGHVIQPALGEGVGAAHQIQVFQHRANPFRSGGAFLCAPRSTFILSFRGRSVK